MPRGCHNFMMKVFINIIVFSVLFMIIANLLIFVSTVGLKVIAALVFIAIFLKFLNK